MLTCLASESTSPTFVTFPPQVLSMGERGAWLWFPCTRPVSYCCSLFCHPCSSPTRFPVALEWLENTHIPPGPTGKHPHPPQSPALPPAWKGWLNVGAGTRGDNINVAFPSHIPARVSQELWKNIKQHKTAGKISIIGQSVAAELFERGWGEAGWTFGLLCQHRKGWMGRMFSENSSAAVLMKWIQPSIREHPLRHPFVPNIGVGVLWTAGVLGTGV